MTTCRSHATGLGEGLITDLLIVHRGPLDSATLLVSINLMAGSFDR